MNEQDNVSTATYDALGNVTVSYTHLTKLVNEIVLMWRVKTNASGWLAWVSNADPEYMSGAKSTYQLDGSLDSTSYYAGKGTENVTGIEIKIFSNVSPSESTTSVNFDGTEITPTRCV